MITEKKIKKAIAKLKKHNLLDLKPGMVLVATPYGFKVLPENSKFIIRNAII